ncbi:MAG: PEGA domain-containing protein [Proteobacteria bacterium]|nr:PEGA domain-containing protein [Pseudomonadota bacterium]
MRTLILLITSALIFTIACGGAQKIDVGPRGTLRFEGEPKDALIELDEVHMGPIRMFESKGLLLRPGEHRVIVRAEGYFPEYRLVEIRDGEVISLKVELRPVPE